MAKPDLEGVDVKARVPGRDETVLVRDRRGVRTFERWSAKGRISSIEIGRPFAGGWPSSILFQKKGTVARVICGDEGRAFSFYVELGGEKDRLRPAKPFPPAIQAVSQWTSPDVLVKLAHESAKLAEGVARNPVAAPKLVAWLAKHDDPRVRRNVARRNDLPVALQRLLAKDHDPAVRLALLHTKRPTDARVLAKLAMDTNAKIRTTAKRKSGTPVEALASSTEPLAERLEAVRWGIPIALEQQLATDPSVQVRLKLAVTRHPRKCGRSPSIDGQALKLLLSDVSDRVRTAARALKPYPPGTREPPP